MALTCRRTQLRCSLGGISPVFSLCHLMPSRILVLPVNWRLSLKTRLDLGSVLLAKILQDRTEHRTTSLVFSGRPLFAMLKWIDGFMRQHDIPVAKLPKVSRTGDHFLDQLFPWGLPTGDYSFYHPFHSISWNSSMKATSSTGFIWFLKNIVQIGPITHYCHCLELFCSVNECEH